MGRNYHRLALLSLLILVGAIPWSVLFGVADPSHALRAGSQAASQALQPCVVLKRMGPADQVTSHLYSVGIRGKQYQFVEGDLPRGVKFHGRLTDHDVRQIQDAGGKVTIIDAHYTDKELQDAHRSCSQSGPDSASAIDPPKSAADTPKPAADPPKPATDAAKPEVKAQPNTQSSAKALGKVDIVDLLKGDVPSSRVTSLIKERGIKFDPTDDDYKDIRAAGADDNLINVLKAAALLRE
jgi:hypothetical protein